MSLRKKNVLRWALALSLVAHIATMIAIRPKIMTRIASGFDHKNRRPTMTVTDAPPEAENVRIEVIRDIDPIKDSPDAKVEESVPMASSPIDLSAPAIQVAPTANAEVLSMPTLPEENVAPKMSEKLHVNDYSAPTVPDPSDTMSVAKPDVESTGPAISAFSPDIATPAFTAPTFNNNIASAMNDAPEFTIDKPEEEKEKEIFKPSVDITSTVDEKIVEAEKTAVRDLLDARNMAELSKYVNIGSTSAQEGTWTYFKVRFDPKAELPTVPKDVVILLDASGSIGNDRLQSCRAAARRILRSVTNTGDRFNLVAFRDKFTYAFKSWQPCDSVSFNVADTWLGRLAAHGRTDVFSSIRSVLTLMRDPMRPLIAVVVTDGDANAGVRATSDILSKFTALNDGLISVYMYGVKESANKELLDLLTHGNRGESYIYSGDRHQAGGGLEPFAQKFRDPVLSDIRVVFTSSSQADMYPRRLKNLYAGDVVEFYGRVPSNVREVSFSIKGLNGNKAYEGFFRIKLSDSAFDASLPAAWRAERAIDQKLK